MISLLLLPFAAVFVGLAFVCAGAVGLLSRLSSESRSPSSAWRALVALAPILVALLGCVALASPNLFSACHCAQHGLHHPHLCIQHPRFALPLLLPAALMLGAWAIVVIPRVLRLARDVIASERWARTARNLPPVRVDGVDVRLADNMGGNAFTAGIASPTILFDRALWIALSDEERRAVAHHEDAHLRRRDGLTLLSLQLCAALCPIIDGARVIDAWRGAAETSCDAYAARALGDAAAVAGALIAVGRARATLPDTPPASCKPMLGIVAGHDLERRVLALLMANESQLSISPLKNDLFTVSLLGLGAAALTTAWPGDWFHHAVETLIGLFVH